METVNNLNPSEVLKSTLNDPELSPAEKVKRLMGLRGGSISSLARDLNRHEVHVHNVLSGRRSSKKLQKDIAEYLSVAVEIIWPN